MTVPARPYEGSCQMLAMPWTVIGKIPLSRAAESRLYYVSRPLCTANSMGNSGANLREPGGDSSSIRRYHESHWHDSSGHSCPASGIGKSPTNQRHRRRAVRHFHCRSRSCSAECCIGRCTIDPADRSATLGEDGSASDSTNRRSGRRSGRSARSFAGNPINTGIRPSPRHADADHPHAEGRSIRVSIHCAGKTEIR